MSIKAIILKKHIFPLLNYVYLRCKDKFSRVSEICSAETATKRVCIWNEQTPTMFSVINTYYRQALGLNTKRQPPEALRLSLPSFTLFYNNTDLLPIHCVCVCTTVPNNIRREHMRKIKDKDTNYDMAAWNTGVLRLRNFPLCIRSTLRKIP